MESGRRRKLYKVGTNEVSKFNRIDSNIYILVFKTMYGNSSCFAGANEDPKRLFIPARRNHICAGVRRLPKVHRGIPEAARAGPGDTRGSLLALQRRTQETPRLPRGPQETSQGFSETSQDAPKLPRSCPGPASTCPRMPKGAAKTPRRDPDIPKRLPDAF